MKGQVSVKMTVVALILALTVIPGPAQGSQAMASPASGAGGFVWFTKTVDSSGNRGTHTDIAFTPTSDTPWVSYYDEGTGDLRVAHRVGSGGNCGPNNEWHCETVDSTGDVGQTSSIDVYINPSIFGSLRVGVAYQSASGAGALKFAEYSCASTPPLTCLWSAITIDPGVGGIEGDEWYTSIKYDAGGRPHIAYYVSGWTGDIHVNELRFAYRRDSSTGNCGPSNYWTCYTVNMSAGSGRYQYVSMEMTYSGSTLIPYVAYYDGTNGDLMLARYVGGTGGSGCTHSSWSCQTIDGASADVGQSVSLELTNAPYFAYYDATNRKVKYAYRVSTGGGNCGGGDFRCVTIDDATPPSGARSISLAVDRADNPLIAYRQSSGGVSQLRVAQPVSAMGLPAGNCGPLGVGAKFLWQCLTVDTGSTAPIVSVADHVSAAFDPNGLPAIAYSRWGTTVLGTDTDLKIAYGRIGTFLPLVLRKGL